MAGALKYTMLIKDNKTGKTTAVYSDFRESLVALERMLNPNCSSIIKSITKGKR
jgi:hypothetical protein